jgi:hypothetical protein
VGALGYCGRAGLGFLLPGGFWAENSDFSIIEILYVYYLTIWVHIILDQLLIGNFSYLKLLQLAIALKIKKLLNWSALA